MSPKTPCGHMLAITELKTAKTHACEECVKIGSAWVHLRTCQTCGATLCCDDSPHRHMTAHAEATAHPVIISSEPGERWMWCYPDKQIRSY